MSEMVRRVFVEKREGFDVEARQLLGDLKENVRLTGLTGVRILKRYDISGLDDQEYAGARDSILSEPNCDQLFEETFDVPAGCRAFAVEYLPGQYDQRADSAAQCVQLLTQKERPLVRSATMYVLQGTLSDEELARAKAYLINPVESREASLAKPDTLVMTADVPPDVPVLEGFITLDQAGAEAMCRKYGLAMSVEDLLFVQKYYRDEQKRDPSFAELRVIDTYWSDHCRHTTFATALDNVEIELSPLTKPIFKAYQDYLALRHDLGREKKTLCLMDMATIGARELARQGKLDNFDKSEEINACSIKIKADIDGQLQDFLVQFKNETHNHPTEIEPFGGAATCLGGAIRDPLAGRAYVYQAMRITGCADPRTPIEQTLPGKLPQKKITRTAAAGYSSYGNQIGLAAGKVQEIYHPGYVAKHMELGAVIAATPEANVVRKAPEPGDIVLLIGGRTGRDGCGGATGSSKSHNNESLASCGAEVQKGNPLTERNIQRLFRTPEFSRLVKRCNDFGAGGVCVAIGELAPGLDIDLDKVPKKYDGLDGTELAISESQERMAVVVRPADVEKAIALAHAENLEATQVAVVKQEPRMTMTWRGKTIIDISRAFLDTNGVTQHAEAEVEAPAEGDGDFFRQRPSESDWRKALLGVLADLNVCSQKGLVERFDGSIGAATVLSPYGGKMRLTPNEAMAAKLPVAGWTNTCTLMSHGFNPYLCSWSPFHGGVYSVVESLAKIAAAGGDASQCRLSLQEFFQHMTDDATGWGKPFAALMGALRAQLEFGTAAIGGKDSMSGTFENIHVPPTIVSFAVVPEDARKVISPELKNAGSRLFVLTAPRDETEMPDFAQLRTNFANLHQWISEGKVVSAATVGQGGIAAAISKMAFGNMLGVQFDAAWNAERLFSPDYGAIVLETAPGFAGELPGAESLGKITAAPELALGGQVLSLAEAVQAWTGTLEKVFPTSAPALEKSATWQPYTKGCVLHGGMVKSARPRVFIPVFPGSNCEYDSQKAFEKAGAVVEQFIVRNKSAQDIEESVAAIAAAIARANIVMIPGGFSGGDEPDGSGKFIATTFRNPRVTAAVTELLKSRDGLMLGICNGFQALIKLGLVPYGEIRPVLAHDDPTLTFNTIGRHAATLVNTVVASNLSPWLANCKPGDVHTMAISHGEGRFVATPSQVQELFANGQVAFQYCDLDGKPAVEMPWNPNGSIAAIEGITSADGRVLGKMGHSERAVDSRIAINVPGEKDQRLFEAGVAYFK
ncbi:MAG: phosphoribosylformylglycinamidine synthase [Victivallales bacterium]|nr:phosphoribosylformylglycinamidine synthase [Victivallales bacterium]